MTSSESDWTVCDWQQKFESCRTARPIAAALPGKSSWGGLESEFKELTRRIRTIHESFSLSQLAAPALLNDWQRCLELVQLLSRELARSNRVPAAQGQQLFQQINHSLRELERQFTLCSLADDIAEQLGPLCDSFLSGQETSARKLLQLADELIMSLSNCRLSPATVPSDSRLLSSHLAQGGWKFTDQVALATLVSRACAEFSLGIGRIDQHQIRGITAAALIQDLGLLHDPYERSRRHRMRSQANPRRVGNPNHPGIAAAILGRLTECPSMIPVLVGQHHERLDGSGFPQRLTRDRLTFQSRWLGVIIRFYELLCDEQTADLATATGEPGPLMAGVRLWREVQRGALGEPESTSLLNCLEPDFAVAVQDRYHEWQRRMIDRRHGLRGPRVVRPPQSADELPPSTQQPGATHSSHDLAAPAYFRRQRSGHRRSVLRQYGGQPQPAKAREAGDIP